MNYHKFGLIMFSLLAVQLISTSSFAEEEKHWSYSGADGPEHWDELNADWRMCGSGRNQSPIDLRETIDADLPELILDWTNPGITDSVNNGHAIQANTKPGNYTTIAGHRYQILQFHFHSPSEHLIAGQSYPMEVHLVHSDEDGNLAVIGVMFEIGERNALLDQIPSFRSPDQPPPDGPVDFNQLISSRTEYFSYNGSLTTPPCSEGVKWTILKTPITASADQIDRFVDTFDNATNRPVQPANARTILE